jgi:ribonuclease-3
MKYLNVEELEKQNDNFKSIVLEWSQKHGHEIEFIQVSKMKNDKRDFFKMALLVNGEMISEAEDFNKKAAEQRAAEIAIENLKL